MLRTLAAAAVTAALAGAGLVGLASPAFADGGCPSGGDWTLASTGIAIDALDNGNFADKNGDGKACFRVNAGQTSKHDDVPSFTWKDNTN